MIFHLRSFRQNYVEFYFSTSEAISFGGRTAKVHAGATEMLLFDQCDELTSFGKIVCQWDARLSCP
jgi:hypothetical protein